MAWPVCRWFKTIIRELKQKRWPCSKCFIVDRINFGFESILSQVVMYESLNLLRNSN